jgi:DNA-binding XRE family transcriptional regulator
MKTFTQLREEKGLTQGDLALVLGVSRITINKWENNRSTPRLNSHTTLKLLRVLGIDLRTLISLFEK